MPEGQFLRSKEQCGCLAFYRELGYEIDAYIFWVSVLFLMSEAFFSLLVFVLLMVGTPGPPIACDGWGPPWGGHVSAL